MALSFLWRRRSDHGGAAAFYRPYLDDTANRFYNLLFCNTALFRDHGAAVAGPLRVLAAARPSPASLRTIVDAEGGDSRLRALAAQRLLQQGQRYDGAFCCFGAILEVPMSDGLEVLAAYDDGAVRHLAADGRAIIYDSGPSEVRKLAAQAVDLADARAARVPPWKRPRLPPPLSGDVRLSMLCSDGLRFVQGPFASLQKDRTAQRWSAAPSVCCGGSDQNADQR